MVTTPRTPRPKRPRGAGPVASATPPPARFLPTIGGDRPPPPARRIVSAGVFADPGAGAGGAGRVVAVYGAPERRQLLRIVQDASKTTMAVVSVDGQSELEMLASAVEVARRIGTKVIILDGAPRTALDVQWLFNQRYVTPVNGCIIQVAASSWVPDEATQQRLTAIERHMTAVDIVHNRHVVQMSGGVAASGRDEQDLEHAVWNFLGRMGVYQ